LESKDHKIKKPEELEEEKEKKKQKRVKLDAKALEKKE
jgi:hypothetical protein